MKKQDKCGDRKKIGRSIFKKIARGWFYSFLCLLILMLAACSSPSLEDKSLSTESTAMDQVVSEEAAVRSGSDASFDKSKIIYNGRIGLNTDHYQESFDKIINYVEKAGGFIQESGSNFTGQGTKEGNSGYLTIRIPTDGFSEAMETIQSFGSPTNADISSSNISQQYQDVESQLNNLKLQEQRLLELLGQATNMTDVLAIESELNRIRTESDQLTSTKKNWDIEISYATIYVSLYEKEISSTSVSSPFSGIISKIGGGFVKSLNLLLRLMAFLLVMLVSLIPFAGVALLGVFIFIKIRKKIREKKGEEKKDKSMEDQNDQSSLE